MMDSNTHMAAGGTQANAHKPMGRLVRAATVATVIAGVAVGLATTGAQAYQRYQVTNDGVALRSGPGTQYELLGRVNTGTPVDIDCQVQGGTNVHGNATWDRLTGGQWVADYFTSTPSFNSYAPGLKDCNDKGSAATARPVSSREERAVQWAQSKLGQSYDAVQRHPWNGWCDNFIAQAFGRSASGYHTAILHFQDLSRRPGVVHRGDRNVPRGALAFFGATRQNGGAGHVMISTGGGNFVTTDVKVRNADIGWAERVSGPYLGWAYANAEWSGR